MTLFIEKLAVACFAAFAALAAGLPASASDRAPAFDIVGLRLGMTETEARAALAAHDPGLVLSDVKRFYGYSDGVKSFQTETFLWKVEGRKKGAASGSWPSFALYFSPPPGQARLVIAVREEAIASNRPSKKQYTDALVQKYGSPAAQSRDGIQIAWDFPGGLARCLRERPDSASTHLKPHQDNYLMQLLNNHQQRRIAPADLSTCASSLFLTLNGEPVDRFQAMMVDVAGFARADKAANDWVKKLEAEARKARESQGQAPKL